MASTPRTFQGYRRADGTVGIRNQLVVIPSVICANTVAERVAALIPGAVAIPHPHGCAQVGDDVVLTEQVLAGAAANPNVGAALIIGLGCETCQATDVAELARALAPGRSMHSFYIQDAGGSIKAIAQGVEAGKQLLGQIAAQQRETVPLSELVLATKCGDVEASTRQASNVTSGVAADLLLDSGGTVLLAETPDLVGAADALVGRARDTRVAGRLRELLQTQPSAGTEQAPAQGRGTGRPGATGGTGTGDVHEIGLGCVSKAGSGPIEDVLHFAQRPSKRGLSVMDTPSHDTVAVSAMAAAGAQLCLFTTGRGSPVGNAIVPVLKICGDAETSRRMADNIDFSTVAIAEGRATRLELGAALFQTLVDVCNGRLTNAEIIGHQEFAIHRVGPTV
jgi:altronate dehydratase large subunit